MIESKEMAPVKTPPNKYDRPMAWKYLPVICSFYLYPMLGYKNETVTAITFNVKGPTLRGWATKSQLIPKWIVRAKELCLNDMIQNSPSPYCLLDMYI